ncbi:hypothetical protein N7466_004592 [Penicillium verhagenii]|uniref:uncharacterized protein n=1 Tax=Penicillium verhagenii TaxID=1562060 RepID=UPI0025456B5B|nr:uncharacterized protein N7466_004592 [Penicillium verhagenii]KAJ5935045.1 hypothetical protein N7466_004592 [Penicillium verhagenii]
MSIRTCSILLATVGLVAAQTSVVSMFIPFADPQPLAASIVGKSAGTTTYSINCPPGTDSDDCGMGPGLWMTAGPTTTRYSLTEPDVDFYDNMDCSVGGTTTAVCTEVVSGTGANDPGTDSTTYAPTDITLLPVTITAGPATTSAASTATESTGSSDSANTSSSDKTGKTGSTASSTSAAASTSASSGTSTGGLSRVTGNPVVALGGAAAALVAAVL